MDQTQNPLTSFLEIPYDKLEELNFDVKEKAATLTPKELEKELKAALVKEKKLKAVTVCFSDIEGRFHMLDYDKKFILNSLENLTFDGSSIHGFSAQHESDLRLDVDWTSMRYLPADVFGPGKVLVFATVLNRDRTTYQSDFRGMLKELTQTLKKKQGLTAYASAEIEGFLVDGVHAEQEYGEKHKFKLISSGGYFNSLPHSRLRVFIDRCAEAQRALAFGNEKDHPEVAPSQFEMNFAYSDIVRAADQIMLYKLICKQIARNLGMTATFLPKPVIGINGSGMHTNFSLAKNGKNIFYDPKGQENLSDVAWEYIYKILNHAQEICLIMNSSVNSYRRLDPHFEAPNQIKVSALDRGSMIRIPVGNEKTSRIEIRSVAPDVNPYLWFYTILRVGSDGKKLQKNEEKRDRMRFLPDNINDAIRLFKSSDFITTILGAQNKEKYASVKQAVADRSPKALGTIIKDSEVLYHHEITNQILWNNF